MRYALSADTPSEVLLHMRLMAAARSDNLKAAVHIHNLEEMARIAQVELEDAMQRPLI